MFGRERRSLRPVLLKHVAGAKILQGQWYTLQKRQESWDFTQPPRLQRKSGWLVFTNLGGGFKYFLFSPRTLGKWSSLTSIFFRWVVQPPTSNTLEVKDHKKNSPLELLIVNPYKNNSLYGKTIQKIVFGLPGNRWDLLFFSPFLKKSGRQWRHGQAPFDLFNSGVKKPTATVCFQATTGFFSWQAVALLLVSGFFLSV